MDLAIKFLEYEGEGYIQLNYITRDKPKEYFREIFKEANGIMRKYEKDGHANPDNPYGSPENPINGGLEGLFFSAIVDWSTHKPFPSSVYGEMRLQLPVDELLTTDRNLYFSDFHCMKSGGSQRHTITLVLCENGSEADEFCKSHLVSLDKWTNHFLRGKSYFWMVTKGAYVEIFYTESIDISPYNINKYMKVVDCEVQGRNPNPQKNTHCKHCNPTKSNQKKRKLSD